MSGESVGAVARSKLNLALRVGPIRSDGYHPVESLMAELSDPHDRLDVRRADRRRVLCAGIDERDNLVWSALDVLATATGRPLALEVEIEKGIPAGAGLGGGSSDAAAVLRAARELCDLPLDDDALEEIATEVGSDVPFFVRGGTQWARGRGEDLGPADRLAFHALVCFRGPPLATSSVYARFDAIDPPVRHRRRRPPVDDPAALADWAHNDLWPAARQLRPDLGDLAAELEDAGAVSSLLCGSGAAVCGLFADADAARRARELMSPRAATWLAGPAPE